MGKRPESDISTSWKVMGDTECYVLSCDIQDFLTFWSCCGETPWAILNGRPPTWRGNHVVSFGTRPKSFRPKTAKIWSSIRTGDFKFSFRTKPGDNFQATTVSYTMAGKRGWKHIVLELTFTKNWTVRLLRCDQYFGRGTTLNIPIGSGGQPRKLHFDPLLPFLRWNTTVNVTVHMTER